MIRATHATRARPGFTLLELLVAVTIMASISALVAALWSQTRAWTGENAVTMKTMRLARVRALARDQWSDRRGAFKLDDSGATALATPDRLSFVTATAILFPDWPLVRAEYVIAPDFNVPRGAPAAWKLVYEETRISDLTKPPPTVEKLQEEGLTESMSRMDLLTGLPRLVFERFGVGSKSRQKGGSLVSDEPRDGAQPLDATEPRTDADEDAQRWRPFDEPFDGEIPAVRIAGEFEHEEFECLFVIAASR